MEIIKDYDVVVNCGDNFPTRYLINDACVFAKKPLVDGAIFRFEGNATVFHPAAGGPCYRCLYPEPAPPDMAPSCAEAGVLGALPGVIGSIEALEAIKLLLGAGKPLIGKMVYFDTLSGRITCGCSRFAAIRSAQSAASIPRRPRLSTTRHSAVWPHLPTAQRIRKRRSMRRRERRRDNTLAGHPSRESVLMAAGADAKRSPRFFGAHFNSGANAMALGPFYVANKMKGAGMKGIALLMRHGETAWNREGRVMGRNEVELDAGGRAQVTAAIPIARELKPELIVTSPMLRARQSAEIIAGGLGNLPVIDDAQLSEVHYGRWEGMVYDDLVNDPDYENYRDHPLDTPTPGGETIEQVQSRGVEAVRRAISANPARRILFVSHGDIIRTVICHFTGLELAHFRRIRVDNATFSGFQIVGDFAETKFVNLLPDPGRAFVSPFVSKKQ